MALVKELDAYDLREEFEAYDRDYYTIDGYQAILDLFEETDCGSNTNLDVIAICCDFDEETPEDIVESYDNLEEIAECVDEDGEIDVDALMDALNYHTWAQLLDNGNILYMNF